MKNRLYNEKNKNELTDDRTLKATSLLYIQEALIAERYEECEGLIRAAKRFGATQEEISSVLSDYAKEVIQGREFDR